MHGCGLVFGFFSDGGGGGGGTDGGRGFKRGWLGLRCTGGGPVRSETAASCGDGCCCKGGGRGRLDCNGKAASLATRTCNSWEK